MKKGNNRKRTIPRLETQKAERESVKKPCNFGTEEDFQSHFINIEGEEKKHEIIPPPSFPFHLLIVGRVELCNRI